MRLPALLCVLFGVAILFGCSKAGDSVDVAPIEPAANESSEPPGGSAEEDRSAGQAKTASLPMPATSSSTSSDQQTEKSHSGAASSAEDTTEAAAGDRLQLAPDLSLQELVRFLGTADGEMRELANSASSAAGYERMVPELKRLANLKRQAAERLAAADSVPPELLKQAKRGRLQALSHLAAMEDLKAADELEAYAEELSESSDPLLAVESRLVLIGFALEQLQGGAAEEPDEVVRLVDELTANTELLDMPALMAISQARGILQQYGYSAAARDVRDKLVLAFAEHPNPEIAAMAQQLAGAARFDRLDALRRGLDEGDTITPAQWRRAATELVREHPDGMTLQYLATAALGFESEKRDEFANAAYEALESGFSNSEDAGLVEELELVMESRQARQQMIGEPLQIDLPGLQGESIDWQDFRGKVVLVPFWAAEYPDSIRVFPLLEQIRAADPNQIAILGVNLDIEDRALTAFSSQMQPDWPSVRSPQVEERGAMSPLAKQVGLASMPYVLVVDRDGTVAAISMSGGDLETIVNRLLQEA